MTTQKKKRTASSGAPSQLHKTGRKGKAAWRKNVDMDDVEGGLEQMRDEERVLGVALQKRADDELFTVDVRGDDTIRKTLPPPPLTHAQKILSARSAVPPPYSTRPSTKSKISQSDKTRLHRIAGKKIRGPFGALVNPREGSSDGTGLQMGGEGNLDLWSRPDEKTKFVEGRLKNDEQKMWVPVDVVGPQVFKVPRPDSRHRAIALKAAPAPHAGQSYNPTIESHQELLKEAVGVEEVKERKARAREARREEFVEMKRKVEREEGEGGVTVVQENGMVLDEVGSEDDGEGGEEGGEEIVRRKDGKRKTRKAINALRRERSEKAAKLAITHRKRLLHSINFTHQVTHQVERDLSARDAGRERARVQRQARYAMGLAGKRFGGKYAVPVGDVDVQLSEDLSESLRRMKVEGNLFRDRMINLQQRGKLAALSRRNSTKSRMRFRIKEKRTHKEFA